MNKSGELVLFDRLLGFVTQSGSSTLSVYHSQADWSRAGQRSIAKQLMELRSLMDCMEDEVLGEGHDGYCDE